MKPEGAVTKTGRDREKEEEENACLEWMKRGVSRAHLLVLSFLEKQSALLSAESDYRRRVMWNSRRKVEQKP